MAEVEAVIRKFRLASAQDDADHAELLAKAINDLVKLGLTQGEAIKYLKPHLRGI